MTGVDRPGPAAGGRPLPAGLLALGMLLYAVCGVLVAALDVTLIPTRYGTTLIPVAPVLTVAGAVLLPAAARGLTDSVRGAVPAAVPQVLTIWLLASGRPEGDVLMPAGDTAWVAYAVLILGTLVPLTMLGVANRPGPWHWPLGPRPAPGDRGPGRLRARAGLRARSGSGSGDAR
ncbi:MAG TPA: hypothetical protein VMB79_01195 [Jatrophihabitans sp.]|nr:hypothetical protein [Jatrophihabitans sp.]